MPVTAKLSRKFYDKFGDELTNELVEWFNQVDLTYRGQLRDLNELNFARFDAKLEQRAAELEAKIEQRTAALEAKIETGLAQLEARVEIRLAALEARIEKRMAALEASLETRMAGLETRVLKWMFLFWFGQAATTVALVFGVVRLVGR